MRLLSTVIDDNPILKMKGYTKSLVISSTAINHSRYKINTKAPTIGTHFLDNQKKRMTSTGIDGNS